MLRGGCRPAAIAPILAVAFRDRGGANVRTLNLKTNQGRRRSKAANLPYAKPPFSAPLQGSGVAPSAMGPMAEAGK